MGVPAFYKWLVNKYAKVVEKIIPGKNNEYEYDNLYLDMNGIIHPCFHPDHSSTISSPTTFDEVFENMYAYIDRLVEIVRPQKLIYLAIDGVAPRAKMNQQRSRRFRTAKDNEFAEEEEMKLREEFERKGKKLLPKLETQLSDSNVITPGTDFMQEVSNALSRYIRRKLKNDPHWSQLEVILSDATVPGEGEHKIMSFIRSKRSLPGYDPNTRHCLYGLDADLIMLALATHEVHFSILREDVGAVREEPSVPEATLHSSIQNIEELSGTEVKEDNQKPFSDIPEKENELKKSQQYQFLHIWILREYLALDMQILDPPEKVNIDLELDMPKVDPPKKFNIDLERIIDDFVFICFFVGNDFLPHMPTLEIHERAIDLLIHVYKNEFKSRGGYLVDMQRVKDSHTGYIKLKRVEKFILSVGTYEEKIFKKRTEIRDRNLRRILSKLSKSKEDEPNEEDFTIVSANASQNNSSSDIEEILENTKELNEMLKARICQKSDIFKDGNVETDKVKLGSVGWKQRYYKFKFLADDPKEVESIRTEIVQKYTEGLCWVLLYYFSDVPSWNWYYPYHYGPFVSDLRGLASVKVDFQKGLPFKPFDQLMAVLPPKSAHALPKAYQELMTDCNSDIFEFYPTDFEVDVEGKRYLWQGICKLPFIEQEKLLNVTRPLEAKIEECEVKRNIQTTNKMFFKVSLDSSERSYSEIEDSIMCVNIDLPTACLQTPCLLEGIELPDSILAENEIEETVLWHEDSGRMSSNRYRSSVNENSTNKFGGRGRGFDPSGRGNGVYQRSSSVNENPTNKFGGVGRGFDPTGRGNGFGQSYCPVQNGYYQPASGRNFGTAGRGNGVNQSYRPVQNVYRQPASGRNFDTAGRGNGTNQNYRPVQNVYHQPASGRNFDPAGRGIGINQSYRPVQNGYYQPASTPQNLNRGIQDLSISTPSIYERTWSNSTEQNSFWHPQNTAWRPVSHPRPNFAGQGSGGYSTPIRPYNASTPQSSGQGRGRGRGPYVAQMYSQGPSGRSMGSGRGRGHGGTDDLDQRYGDRSA